MRGVILASLVVLLVAVAVAGTATTHRQLGSNRVSPAGYVGVLDPGQRLCQGAERVPPGTGAVRLLAGTYDRPGPPLTVTVAAPALGGVHTGRVGGGWHEPSVVVAVPGVSAGAAPAQICVRNDGDARVAIGGAGAPASLGMQIHGGVLGARIRIEYTPAQAQSWWQLLPTMADRAGFLRGGAPGGATLWLWMGLLALAMAGTVAALLARGRRAALLVVFVALANSLAWGLAIPPFQVPDETAHFYYAAYLAETGKLPQRTPDNDWFSPQVNAVLGVTQFYRVIGVPRNRLSWERPDGQSLRRVQHEGLSPVGAGDAATASSNSPEYYALQAVAYDLAPSSAVLERLGFMRILSAILSALTVACVFGFVRELLPRRPWAWTVGGLVAALQPLFGFISSGVNNDGLLYLASAFVLMMLARCFRRGLTPARGALLGLGLGIGVLAKTQLLAYVPAVGLALLLLVWRPGGRLAGRDEGEAAGGDRPQRPPARRGPALRGVATAVVAGLIPLVAYFVLGRTIWHRPPIDRIADATAGGSPATLSGQLSYLWQLYLPRLPFLNDLIPGTPMSSLWIDGLVGRFGWLDYTFPEWVNVAGQVAIAALVLGSVAMLVKGWERTRPRLGELLVYAGAAAGLGAAISWVGFRSRLGTGVQFEQARYLLPLLPLYAGAVALTARLGGRRAGPVIGALIVMLALAHTVFAELLTLTRYYG